MCGIIGMVSPDPVRVLPLDALAHRGPDAQGQWSNGRNVVLGHTRLSILDLHDRANQPMTDDSGRFTIVFNGEIYNYRELRQTHLSGESLRTTSDTEVLLLLWAKMGAACLTLLRGMFAFGIWDDQASKLWLARDRFGQKPLVYHRGNSTLTFASELNALRQLAPSEDIHQPAVDLFLGYQFIPAPHTIYQNTYKLPPAHYALWDGHALSMHRYWQVPFVPRGHAHLDEEEAAERLEEKIRAAVRYRLRSDVPVGSLLSGGVDSSLVTAIAAQESSTPIKTFTVGFRENKQDERPYAQSIADLYGTDHHCYELSVGDSQAYLDQALKHYGEPFGDSSALPTLMVCERAAQSVKVTLCGDGGDELLAGYPFFHLGLRDRWGGGTLKRRHHWARAIGSLRQGRPQESVWARLTRNLSAAISPLQRTLVYEHYCREQERPTLYRVDFLRQVQSSRQEYQASLLDEADAATYPLNQLLAIHYAGYFANGLLVKTDIASMAYGLEMRAPLLDHELMEFAATLNPNLKYRKGVGKYLLKKVARKYVPPDLLYRPKRGFSVPVAEWMRSHFSTQIRDMVATTGHPLWQYLNSGTVSRWLDQHQAHQINHGKRLWLILLLGLWLDRA